MLGMPILIAMAPKEPDKWAGEIYNSHNGKMYCANISLVNTNTLELEGCLVWPLCQTQQWTRVKTPPPNAAAAAAAQGPSTAACEADGGQEGRSRRRAERCLPAGSPTKPRAAGTGPAKK